MKSQRKLITRIVIIFAFLLSLDGYLIRPLWGAESATNEIVFSLNVKDKPLSVVLRTIYEQTGFNFLVSAAAKNVPVTISLSKVPLQEGLSRVIKSAGISNHAIVFDSGRNISIIIIDGSNIASPAREKPPEGGSIQGGSIQGGRADQSRSAASDRTTIAKPPPPEIFSRHGRQGNSQPEIASAPPKEVYERRHYTRQ